MPVIEVTIPQGAIPVERLEPLLQDLTRILIKWEGVADPNDPRVAATVLAYISEIPAGRYAGGSHFSQPVTPLRSLVYVTVPQGVLTDERKQGLVEEVTRTLLVAEGEPEHRRVYCLINEIADGNWSSGGRITRLRDLIARAGLDPSSVRYKELQDALQ